MVVPKTNGPHMVHVEGDTIKATTITLKKYWSYHFQISVGYTLWFHQRSTPFCRVHLQQYMGILTHYMEYLHSNAMIVHGLFGICTHKIIH